MDKVDIMTMIKELFWKPIGLRMENGSTTMLASARALAKLGAFMANKG